MNCKQGDLAVIVRSRTPSNVGKIVKVLRPYTIGDEGVFTMDARAMLWLCETKGSELEWPAVLRAGFIQSARGPIPDECLKPIRDVDGEQDAGDETKIVASGPIRAQQTECA